MGNISLPFALSVPTFLTRGRVRGPIWGLSAALVLGLLASALGSAAQALAGESGAAEGLMVAPTRLVFEGRTRGAQVTLVNRGTKRALYRVTLVNRRMGEDGSFEPIEEARPGELFATDLVRYAPRRVVLEPGGYQTVRILVRKPRDLPAGEYRSHLLFQAVPDSAEDPPSAATNGISVRLRAVFGVTIPVIVRHGKIDARVAIRGAELQSTGESESPPSIAVHLARSGQSSVYGDIRLTLIDDDGEERHLGEARGVAVYSPNRSRTVRVPIAPALAPQLAGRRIKVNYTTPAQTGARTLAEDTVTVR